MHLEGDSFPHSINSKQENLEETYFMKGIHFRVRIWEINHSCYESLYVFMDIHLKAMNNLTL